MPGAAVDHERHVLTLSQSWLQDFQRCPERARLDLLYPSFRHTSETVVGTAIHTCMEGTLLGAKYDHALEAALAQVEEIIEDEAYVSTQGKDTMVRHVKACTAAFNRHVLPQVPPGGLVEAHFTARLAEVDEWSIVLEGRPDYVDPFARVWDWKSSGSDWNVRETARWTIQPTAYTFLASQGMGGHVTDFTYAVAVKPHGFIQFIDVERHPADWQWLARVALGALHLVRHLLHTEWPVVHTHYLCSEKWCPHWDGCRGKYMHEEGDAA